jgi:hypothetical protein
MSVLHVTITDEQGNPLNGVVLTNGQYNSTPCSWNSWGCTSGPGSPQEGTTDSTGTCNFDIPYTCAGSWTGTWQSQGYEDLPWSYTSGSITGDIWLTYQMVQNESQSGTPAPNNSGSNNYAGSWQNQWTASGQGTQLQFGQAWSQFIGDVQNYWYVFVALGVVGVVAIIALRRKHT